MSGGPAPASIFATELLAELVRRGVQDVVVCPGSRSQALALAAAAAEEAGAIRLHVRVDERSAAFFALGIARETGFPAPIIVTSGTAVANLTPAAFEAHEGRVPFIALTADRPAAVRGQRGSQTTRQADMFGPAARLALDVPAPAIGANGDLDRTPARNPQVLAATALQAALGRPGGLPAGPVQLNLQFVEPLSGTAGFDRMIADGFRAAAAEGAEARAQADPPRTPVGARPGAAPNSDPGADVPATTYTHDDDALTVVVAGAAAGTEAEEFARAAGLPLLAEVVSGSRFGREAITAYATLIDDPKIGGLTERAIVFGHPTLTRQVPALLTRDDVEVIVVDPHSADHFNPGGRARVVSAARIGDAHDPRTHRRWLHAWVAADRDLQRERSTVHEPDLEAARETGYKERNAYARAEVAVRREPVSRELLVESVWRATWPHDRLVLAASRLVRELDALAPARKLNVHSNRGLAGIDGTVATALGIATASQAIADPEPSTSVAGVTRLIIGDLALLHDAGSLLLEHHGTPPAAGLAADVEPEPANGPAGTSQGASAGLPRIQVFVGNDNGGTIFDGLEVAGSAAPDAFARVMRTPQRANLEQLAAAYGWSYVRVTTRGELEQLLTAPVTGPTLVEIPLA